MIMSKSLAADALLTAVDGGHVGIFGHTKSDTNAVFQDFLTEYPELKIVADVIHALGGEYMTFPGGGTLRFLSFAGAQRAQNLDRCYVPIGSNRDVVDELLPYLAASKDGTLAGY
ncbi:hypothetical protein DM793_18715 [Paenarthrobacter nitroguajacolicus]|uniref:hypothetical protein n=1 Tax=Paenarthrobacter nitroguajacolicus TaxID=211146 RepID=UPI0015C0A2C6|nr:hypothetical protein [Paenarthrobacter nitroguajacolicus]NWL13301.1 hypothetical protein [Paenarthrobacter nitroguajacolicus]